MHAKNMDIESYMSFCTHTSMNVVMISRASVPISLHTVVVFKLLQKQFSQTATKLRGWQVIEP